jgi:large subunit ribosomal protein LP2
MKYLSAYCLSVLSGNANPSAKDITNILTSVGVEVDAEKVNNVVNSL